jgi:tRNA wybutosine-synthesizing protein 3
MSKPSSSSSSSSSALPSPPSHFVRKKERILALLAVPDAEYSDASPKGSVDAGIRDLIGEINALDGFVTTSSCAGRVSVFVEGNKKAGGKGGGGAWLFVSHDPVVIDANEDARALLGMGDSVSVEAEQHGISKDMRLVHFKFEPMVGFPLVLCA